MWIVFIIILVIGGLLALGFNIWNYTDNKKRKSKEETKKELNLDRSYEQTSRPQTVEETEQTKRIIKQWEEQQQEKKLKK
jgi:Flp pilus assembly protein TadB